MLKQLKHKVNVTNKTCAKHEHDFMVVTWNVSANKKWATQFACRHCLMTLGMGEYETLRQHHNDCVCDAYDEEVKAMAKV